MLFGKIPLNWLTAGLLSLAAGQAVFPVQAKAEPEPLPAKATASSSFVIPVVTAAQENQMRLEMSYRRAWKLVKDNSMYPERLKQWDGWEHKFDGKLYRDADLEAAINSMLKELDDQYTYYRTVDQTQQRCQDDDEHHVVERFKLAAGVGYVQIKTFCSHHVAEELQAALLELKESKSLVLDLRDNRGGYVEQALLCFSLLVDRGKFVSIEGRQDAQNYLEHVFVGESGVLRMVNGKLTREPRMPDLSGARPIVVMVNDGTRSAAEMLAGALREQRSARLVGSKTFGKGVVQGTWFLDSGSSIKIAMARFFLPAGECINGHGLMPDVEADFSDENAIISDPEGIFHVAFRQPAGIVTSSDSRMAQSR